MSWANPLFRRRLSITIDNVTGGGADPLDVDLIIPPSLDVFWDSVLSNGFDMLLTEANGSQPISLTAGNCTGWDRGAAFSKATKTGSIRIDGWTNTGASKHPPQLDRMLRVFLYYDNPSAVADLTDATVAALTPRGAAIAVEHPRSTPLIRTAAETVGSVKPSARLSKSTGETVKWYWDFGKELHRRFSASSGRRRFEEVKSFNLDAESRGVADNSVVTEVDSLFVSDDVIATVQTAGTDGKNHTVKLLMETTEGRILERRALMVSNNVKD